MSIENNRFFSPTFCLCVAKAEMCVDSLIPGLEAPQAQQHSGQPDLIPTSMPGQRRRLQNMTF